MPLTSKPLKLLLRQQVFDVETRLSLKATEELPKEVLNAVRQATRI